MNFLHLFAAAVSLAVASCGTTTLPNVETAEVVQGKVVLEGTRALVIAHNAYQGAAAAATVAVNADVLTPAQVEKVAYLNDKAAYYLEGGGTVLSAAERATAVLDIVLELQTIVGG